jgi:hypothetical protein
MSEPQTNIYLIFYFSKMASVLSCVVLSCPVLFAIGGQTDEPIGLKIGTKTHWNYAMKIGGVGDRECAFKRTLRAQMCAEHHISSIGGQTAGPVEPQIGTHTHWDNGQ